MPGPLRWLDHLFLLHGLLEAGFGAAAALAPHALLRKRPQGPELPDSTLLVFQMFGVAIACLGLIGLLLYASPASAAKRRVAACFALYHAGAAYGSLSPPMKRRLLALGIDGAEGSGAAHLLFSLLFLAWVVANGEPGGSAPPPGAKKDA